MRSLALVVTLGLTAVGCDMPRDPEGTLQRVRGGTMRVGVTEADPFVTLSGDEPSGGVEVLLVERFAKDIDADIEWFPGSEEELLSALEVRELDLVIGGLTSTSPWASRVTLTHPYLTTFAGVGVPEADHVMAVPLGENAWLVALERFLLERPDEIDALLDQEGAL